MADRQPSEKPAVEWLRVIVVGLKVFLAAELEKQAWRLWSVFKSRRAVDARARTLGWFPERILSQW